MKIVFPFLLFAVLFLSSGNAVAAAEFRTTVQSVIDGDTVRLMDGRLVRYIGIDAPEIDHKNHRADPLGYESRDENRTLVNRKVVRIVTVNGSTDRYRRLLAYIFDDKGRCINQIMVEKGLAHVLYSKTSAVRHEALLKAQRAAMQKQVGIWQKQYRYNKPVLANTRSKRFHAPHCPFAKQINPKNKLKLKDAWQAYWQGFAPCSGCLPSSVKK